MPAIDIEGFSQDESSRELVTGLHMARAVHSACMLICARCRERPCSCGADLREDDPEAVLARIAAIRSSATKLSPEYIAWLDGEGDEPEPAIPPDLRSQILALVEEVDLLLGGPPDGALTRPAP